MATISSLKKQIKSINSISKITKAMELVSTAKLKKVGRFVNESKDYFREVYTIFNDIISKADNSIYQIKNLEEIKDAKTCWLIINSNLGLCGGYNTNVNKLVLKEYKKGDKIFLLGEKGKGFYKSNNIPIYSFDNNVDINFEYEDAREIAIEILSLYNLKEVQSIKIAYTKFINNVTFEATILNLLPILKKPTEYKGLSALTEFEPSADAVLNNATPLYANSIIYSTIMESQVSEQASRRNSMENATNNAEELNDKLSLQYNRKRQASITQEILEIIAGANAQKKG